MRRAYGSAMRIAIGAALLAMGCTVEPSDKPTPFDEIECGLEWAERADPPPTACSRACERPPDGSISAACRFVGSGGVEDECNPGYVEDYEGTLGCCAFGARPVTAKLYIYFAECI